MFDHNKVFIFQLTGTGHRVNAAAKEIDTVSDDRPWGLRTSMWFSHSSLLSLPLTKLTDALVLKTMLWSTSSKMV